jgi:hypothetical protein
MLALSWGITALVPSSPTHSPTLGRMGAGAQNEVLQ